MKSLDLRIGNLVERLFEDEHNDFEEVTVRTLWEIVQVESGNTSKFQFKPIPLTEEWLKRFGFKQSSPMQRQKDWFNFIKILDRSDYTDGTYRWNGNENHVILKYVHQLQNLYFALTGQELHLEKL